MHPGGIVQLFKIHPVGAVSTLKMHPGRTVPPFIIQPEGTLNFCLSWPRLKLNTKIGLHTTCHPPPTTTQTLRQQYLSCYWPDLDQTLNKGSWKHIQQITTVTTTVVQATFAHISNISAVTDPIWIKL